MEKLKQELDAAVQVPGLTNLFVPPIRNRIDMLATGVKSPIGIKVFGPELKVLAEISGHVEQVARTVPGVSSAVAERINGGRYLDVEVTPQAAERYGFPPADVPPPHPTGLGRQPGHP